MIEHKLTGRRRHRVGVQRVLFQKLPVLVLQVEVHRTGHDHDPNGGIMEVNEKVWRDARVEDIHIDEIGRQG